VTLKVKFSDFQIITRSRTLSQPVGSEAEIAQVVETLMQPLFPVLKGIRLLGVTLSSLGEEAEDAPEDDAGQPQLSLTL
jgi:DNA polymerase-4